MVEKVKNKVIIKPEWVFNTYSVLIVKPSIDGKTNEIEIDLSNVKIVDTEGIKFFYNLAKEGKKVIVKNPPELMFTVLKILDIEDIFTETVNISQ